jgi:hypothetical protein
MIIRFTIERDEYDEEGCYCAKHRSEFVHNEGSNHGCTLDSVIETFREVVAASGFSGAERIVLENRGTK